MEVEILEETKTKLMLRIKKEDIGFFSLLVDELYKLPDVKFAGYNVDHPLIKNITFLLELKKPGNPRQILNKALNQITTENKKFLKLLVGSMS